MEASQRQHKGIYLALLAILLSAPLFGVLYLDLPFAPYLEFPPTTKYVAHAPFSWPFFILVLAFVSVVCLPFLHRLVTYKTCQQSLKEIYPFPWWGRVGLLIVPIVWFVAWNRFSSFEPVQKYTFFPLWCSYILIVNGLTQRRSGSCLLSSRPGFLLALFPLSALFWWYFEYLNRFVQNWYYLGGGKVSAAEYIIHASVCFSTVLPAVISTYGLLRTVPRLVDPFNDWHPVSLPGKKSLGWFLIFSAVVSLATLAVFPDYLFPLVWISPLQVVVGIQLVNGWPSVFAGMEKGDWQAIVLPALAALICGFFWEMWNWKSLAHWEYSVPFVHRYQVFEMPLLGYAGYLPFGLECLAVVNLLDSFVGERQKAEGEL